MYESATRLFLSENVFRTLLSCAPLSAPVWMESFEFPLDDFEAILPAGSFPLRLLSPLSMKVIDPPVPNGD